MFNQQCFSVPIVLLMFLFLVFSGGHLSPLYAGDPMKIKVVDHEGNGLALAQLRAEPSGGATFFTDSRGVAAIRQPGFMGRTVKVSAHSFGHKYMAKHVDFVPGGTETIQLRQRFDGNVARRAYQLTGGGIYRNSWIFGENTPIEKPLINADVLTHGPMTSTVFGGKLTWFFSATGTPSENGNGAGVSGATSNLPDSGGLEPSRGVNLDYFTGSTGSTRSLLPDLEGETVTLKNLMVPPTDPPQLFATFEVHSEETVRQGIMKWNDSRKQFHRVEMFPDDMRVKLCSNVTRIRTEGREWFYFSCPLPLVRVPATPRSIRDPSRYQTLTPVESGASWDGKETPRADGNRWEWKTGTPTVDHRRELQLRRHFWFPKRAGIHHLTDSRTGESIVVRDGSVFWNDFREKWIMIASGIVRNGSEEGKVFYAEADSPIGPWVYAQKVASHNDILKAPHQKPFSLQNVQQHPFFSQDDGKTIFFSGLFRRTTSEPAIPRYSNNHLMYRLDVTHRRLHLPTPVYMNGEPGSETTYGTARGRSDQQQDSGLVPFYAYPPDRPGILRDDSLFKKKIWFGDVEPIPFWQETREVNGGTTTGLTSEKSPAVTSDTPVFYAWGPDVGIEHEKLTNLLEYRHTTKSALIYVPEKMRPAFENSGWSFQGRVARVWSSPRLDPPTDASARPIRNWTTTIRTSSGSGGGKDSGGGCLIERSGVSTPGLSVLRTARDRVLPTTVGRWLTVHYYTL